MKDKMTEKTLSQETIALQVASSPHLSEMGNSTRKIMMDVVIGLLPILAVSVFIFKWLAVQQIVLCLVSCMVFEAIFTKMRGRECTLCDGSAIITALILAFSLPATAPWYVAVIGSLVAIGIGKYVFGGLGMNIFNPAMVGRAFVMVSFASFLGASAYIAPGNTTDILTQATPLTAFKQDAIQPSLTTLFYGLHNGSIGEISAIASIIGGIYLCLRRSASWEIPAGVITAVVAITGLQLWISPQSTMGLLETLTSGAILFGAFFIATDPVTSPISPKGKFLFGVGIGAFTMLIRIFSGYPEGVMFAVLLMNGFTPLINRWTIPRILGQVKAPKTKAA